MLSTPLVADSVARLFAATIDPQPKSGVRFPEIAGRTHHDLDPHPARRHDGDGLSPRTQRTADQRCTSTSTAVGSSSGIREQDDPWCRFLAAHAGVVVINTDYVLAPHRRFPAPVEQIYDVLQWTSSADRDWDGSALCVGGQSAGGNLAAAASRLAIENGSARNQPSGAALPDARPGDENQGTSTRPSGGRRFCGRGWARSSTPPTSPTTATTQRRPTGWPRRLGNERRRPGRHRPSALRSSFAQVFDHLRTRPRSMPASSLPYRHTVPNTHEVSGPLDHKLFHTS